MNLQISVRRYTYTGGGDGGIAGSLDEWIKSLCITQFIQIDSTIAGCNKTVTQTNNVFCFSHRYYEMNMSHCFRCGLLSYEILIMRHNDFIAANLLYSNFFVDFFYFHFRNLKDGYH